MQFIIFHTSLKINVFRQNLRYNFHYLLYMYTATLMPTLKLLIIEITFFNQISTNLSTTSRYKYPPLKRNKVITKVYRSSRRVYVYRTEDKLLEFRYSLINSFELKIWLNNEVQSNLSIQSRDS